MKRTVNTFLTILFVSFIGFTQAQDLAMAEKIAVIDFATEVVDYGTVEQGSDGMRLFVFTNTGNAPLIISDVKTSCGCTVPTYSKDPILPGGQGQLEIKYNTKKLGNFTKTITVFSNAKETKKVLKIKGKVVAAK